MLAMNRVLICLSLVFVLACGGAPVVEESTETEAPQPAARYIALHKLGSSLGFYTEEGEHVTTVPVGKNPHEMILSSDGRIVYVTDYGELGAEAEGDGGNTVSIIDIAGMEKVGEVVLGEFRRPHGIDLDKAGLLAVSTEKPNRLLIVDPASREVMKDFDTQGEASHMVTFHPDGKTAYVSNIVSENVSVIDLESGSVVLIPVGKRPEGSDITGDGKTLYVANRESHFISVIDTETNEVVGEIPTGKGPGRVRLTPDEGTLVYCLVHDSKVGFADVASGKEVGTVDLDEAPVSLLMSHNGESALTAAQGGDTVYVISVAERKIVRQFETAEGMGPDPVLEIHPKR
jgi:YVTN family beta-propeller protein